MSTAQGQIMWFLLDSPLFLSFSLFFPLFLSMRRTAGRMWPVNCSTSVYVVYVCTCVNAMGKQCFAFALALVSDSLCVSLSLSFSESAQYKQACMPLGLTPWNHHRSKGKIERFAEARIIFYVVAVEREEWGPWNI